MKSQTLPLALVVVSCLVFGSVSLIYPHGRDQGIHAFIADSALSGKVVYRDVFNIKPPLTTFVHALALLLFGHTMTAIRLLDLLWTMATALVLFLLVWRLFGEPWLGALAGILYPLVYYPLGYWYTAQTDGWLNLPLLAATLLMTNGDTIPHRVPTSLAAGVLIGVAVLLKYTALALLPLLAVLLLYWQRTHIAVAVRACLWMTVGFVIVLVVATGWLLASGAMPAFVESQFGLVPAYARLSPGHGLLGRLGPLFARMVQEPVLRLPAVLGAAGLVVAVISSVLLGPWRRGLAVLAVLFATGFASTLSQGKFFVYHYLPLFPALAVLGALAVFVLLRPLARLRPVAAVAGIVFFFLLGFADGYVTLFRNLGNVVSGRENLRDYWTSARHNMGSDYVLRDNIELADYLRETTEPGDRIFIWGFEPGVNFLAQRSTVSRFIYNFPLVAGWHQERFRAELVQVYYDDPAEVFVVEHGDATPWTTGHQKDSFETLMEFPELRDFIPTCYVRDWAVGRFGVFRLAVQR
jgi:hypothetical protein